MRRERRGRSVVIPMLIAIALMLSFTIVGFGSGKELKKDIIIVYTGDINGHIEGNLGVANVTAYANEKKTESPYVEIVNTGNSLSGSVLSNLSKGEYSLKAMNAARYTISGIGMGELTFGEKYFQEKLSQMAEFDFLSANYGEKAYRISSYGNVKVAYIGITDVKVTKESSSSLYRKVQSAVDKAKKEGADYVIAFGSIDDQSAARGENILKNTEGINALLSSNFGKPEKGVPVICKDGSRALLVNTGSNLEHIGELRISDGDKITSKLVHSYPLQDISAKDTIERLKATYRNLLDEDFAESKVNLQVADENGIRVIENEETNLGDLVADSYRYDASAEIGLVEARSLRSNLNMGKVNYAQIINVRPEREPLVVREISGMNLLDALEMSARLSPNRNRGFLQVSGLSFDIQQTIKSSVKLDSKGDFLEIEGDYRVTNVRINGKDLDLLGTYRVAGCKSLMYGKTGYTMLKEGKRKYRKTSYDDMAIIRYIKEKLRGNIGDSYLTDKGRMDNIKLARQSEIEKEVNELVDLRLKEYKDELEHLRNQVREQKDIIKIKDLQIKSRSKLSNRKSGKPSMKLSWETSESIEDVKYQIWKSSSRNRGYRKVFTTSNNTYRNTSGLKKGKRYYYKIRAFKTINGKTFYSGWSNKAYRTVGE